jgi:hypothetical protein
MRAVRYGLVTSAAMVVAAACTSFGTSGTSSPPAAISCTPDTFYTCLCADKSGGGKKCNAAGNGYGECNARANGQPCPGGELADPSSGQPIDVPPTADSGGAPPDGDAGDPTDRLPKNLHPGESCTVSRQCDDGCCSGGSPTCTWIDASAEPNSLQCTCRLDLDCRSVHCPAGGFAGCALSERPPVCKC